MGGELPTGGAGVRVKRGWPARRKAGLVPRLLRRRDGGHHGMTISEAPNRLWGTDATRVAAELDSWGWVFVCVDHANLEIWAEVVKVGDRFAAVEEVDIDPNCSTEQISEPGQAPCAAAR